LAEDAARAIGMRFHATRGSMSIGEVQGGLPPDSVAERESDILEDCIRALTLCGPHRVKHLFVEGRRIVSDGVLTTTDTQRLLERSRTALRRQML
jgi:hypothetical protein